MFDYIKGILTSKNFPYCTIECNGIGYLLLVNYRTIESLCEINKETKIYTKLIHKEDSMTLCGFQNKQDRIIFDLLLGVSGVGVKAAFAILDEFETNDLINIILDENHKLIAKTKGIGPKTAQKIVLEIKDKLTKLDIVNRIPINKNQNDKVSFDSINQAQMILESLGYNENEYKNALETALSEINKDDPQELLKETLKILSIF